MMPVPFSWHTLVTGMAAAVILYKQPLKMWLFLTLPMLLRHFHMTLVPDLITRHTNLLTSSPGAALSDGVLHINMPSPTVCQQSSAPSYAQAQLNNIIVSWSCFWRGQFHALHCLAFSRPRSEAWPYHGQPISIVICCPLLSEAFLFQVQSVSWCCPSMRFLVFLLFFFLVVCLDDLFLQTASVIPHDADYIVLHDYVWQ